MLPNIYEYSNYRKYLNDWLKEQPKQGYGQLSKFAKALKISSVNITHIMSGERDLSAEQAFHLASYLRLDPDESQYFGMLVEYDRTSDKTYKQDLSRRIKALQEQRMQLKNILTQDLHLDENTTGIFFSEWYYNAVALLTNIPECDTADKIAKRLGLSLATVEKALDFLVSKGICTKSGRHFSMTSKRIHLSSDSPYNKARQINWRVKGMNALERASPMDLFFSAAVCCDENTREEIRNDLMKIIKKYVEKISATKVANDIYCMNIDWFKL